MKKIFFVLVIAMLISVMMPCAIVASASEVIPESEESTTDAPSVDTAHDAEINYFDRIIEIWDAYSSELVSGGGFTVIMGILLYICKKYGPKMLNLLSASEASSETQKTQNKVINGLVDGVEEIGNYVNSLRNEIEAVRADRGTTNDHIVAIERQMCALARALEIAYANSKLPQAVKDLVSTECASCIRTAEADINGGIDAPQEATDNE